MMDRGSIFSPHDAFEERLILDRDVLREQVAALKALRMKIVLTSGSFDLAHIGHMRYLREARMLGDCLVVGVDSDEKIRHRKGEFRPIIPELERAEMVAHSRYADIITIKQVGEEKWGLIKLVQPDVLVTSKRNDEGEENLKALEEFCGKVIVFESQATSSTSSNVRKLQMETLLPHLTQIRDLADEMIHKARGDKP
jgi:rfaE bifunctional protein nucleotidyltransferase chain/domain